jgi:NAD(P)-dependent dehydrogenase (short-subunit alcohol dehydrogenase family)
MPNERGSGPETKQLAGRVAVITGAARGLGRAYALLFAAEGAKLVVNDLGTSSDGSGADPKPIEDLLEEVRALGGEAVGAASDVANSAGAEELITRAVDAFGRVDVLVNNAGILRDRMLVNMTDEDWDDVMRVHLRGHFLPSRAAARHWRARSKAGEDVRAALINTSSTSGLFGNIGQTNYGAAKSGLATFTIIADMELHRYGVRCNAVAPGALTRLSANVPGSEQARARRAAAHAFDAEAPSNVAAFVAYLATSDCPIAGKVFYVHGGNIYLFQPWTIVDKIESTQVPWTVARLRSSAAHFADARFDLGKPD